MARLIRSLATIAIIAGASLLLFGAATTLPSWLTVSVAAIWIGVMTLYAEREKPATPKLQSSVNPGPAEAAMMLAQVNGLATIECLRCQKAILVPEWPDHVSWHRLEQTHFGPIQ